MLLRMPSTSLLLPLLDVACDSCFVVAVVVDGLGLGKMCDFGIVAVGDETAAAVVAEFVDERIVGACFC